MSFVKKIKDMSHEELLLTPNFVFLHMRHDIKEFGFCETTLRAHRMSRCAHDNMFKTF
jgi:hypothetical protein